MAKDNSLFDLIKSMSRSEKRYFRLYCSQTGPSSNYLRLFDVIEKQKIYDEQAVKKIFAGEVFIKQLHVTKNYLRTLILKTLRNFHTRISKDAELKDLLRNIEILFHKELYAHCEAEIKKAESIATTYEIFSGRVELGTWKRKLRQALTPHNYDAFLETMTSQQLAIDTLKNTNRYWQLAIRVSRETIARGNQPVPDHALLENLDNAWSLEAKVLHYNATYFRSLQQSDYNQAEQTLYALIAYLETHPVQLAEDPSLYTSSVNNCVSFLVFQKKHEPALQLVQRAKHVYENWRIVSEKKTLFKQIMRTYNIELEIYRDTRSFDQHLEAISGIETFVTKNCHKMPKSYLISFWFQLANIYFMQQKFEASLSWINEILNMRQRDIRMDLQIHSRMMNLMIHLEQQNMFVLRYFVDSTRRFLKKQRKIAQHESVLLKFFSGIAQTPVMEYKQKFKALDATLFPPNGEPLVSNEHDYIDYKRWIQEHV